MDGLSSICGSSVRSAGRTGRLVSISDDKVTVAWHHKGLASEVQDFTRTAARLTEDIQVLTLKEGWVPLAKLVGTEEDQMGTAVEVIAELRAIAGHESLEEALSKKKTKKARKISKYNPFKRYSPIGTGPNVEFGTRTVARQRDWRCKGSGYNQVCQGISTKTKGRVKHVHIDPDYKRAYNKRYKAWASKSSSKSS